MGYGEQGSVGRLLRLAAGVALALLAVPASAETRTKEATELALHEPLPPAQEPESPGVRLGAFVLFPVLGVSEIYDDNIFAARDGRKHDFVTVAAPSLTAIADGSDEYVRLSAGGQIGRYKMHASENYADGQASAEGRFDLSPATRIFGGAWLGRDHEERESADEVFGREPTRYFDLQGYGGLRHRIGPVSVRLGGRIERLDFRDTPGNTGETNNDDRDRTVYAGGVRIAYAVSPEIEPFAQAGFDFRRYDTATDDNRFARDSDGRRLVLGARISPLTDLSFQAFAGIMTQNYDDARLKDAHWPALGASVDWRAAPRTRIGAFLDRTIEETTLANASSSVDTIGALTLGQEIAERLVVQARVGAGQSRFTGTGRADDLVFAGATVTWRINPRISLIGEYHWTGATSTVDGEAYRRNRVLIGVEGRF